MPDETPKKIEKNALRENLKREAIKELSCDRKKSSKMARESLTKSGLVKIQKSDKIGKSVKIKIKSNNQLRQKLNDNLLQNKMRAPKVPRVDSVNKIPESQIHDPAIVYEQGQLDVTRKET